MFLTLRGGGFSDRIALGLVVGAAFASGIVATRLLPVAPAAAISSSTSLPPSEPVRTGYPAQLVRVVDGDTFEARVQVWPGMEAVVKVRLRGIDAPEMSGRCTEEVEQALAARDRLAMILAQGEIGLAQVGQDKYGGRVLASASTRRTPDVSAAMLEAKLVRSYNGGRRDGWCP